MHDVELHLPQVHYKKPYGIIIVVVAIHLPAATCCGECFTNDSGDDDGDESGDVADDDDGG